MKDTEKTLTLTYDEAYKIFSEIEFLHRSLANINRYYSLPENRGSHERGELTGNDLRAYERETNHFIDGSNILDRLFHVTEMISEKIEKTMNASPKYGIICLAYGGPPSCFGLPRTILQQKAPICFYFMLTFGGYYKNL